MEWTAIDMDGREVSLPNREIGLAVVEWMRDTLEMSLGVWLAEDVFSVVACLDPHYYEGMG